MPGRFAPHIRVSGQIDRPQQGLFAGLPRLIQSLQRPVAGTGQVVADGHLLQPHRPAGLLGPPDRFELHILDPAGFHAGTESPQREHAESQDAQENRGERKQRLAGQGLASEPARRSF